MTTAQRVLQLLSEEADYIGPDRITPGMRLTRLGLTASQRIAFAFRLEQEFRIHLDDSHYDAITNHRATFSDVLDVVQCLTEEVKA